jgi:hypothetical protein
MINKLRLLVLSAFAVVSLSAGAAVINTGLVGAVDPKSQVCKGSGGVWNGSKCVYPAGTNSDFSGFISDIVNILLFIVGAVAVVMLVIGGLRYVLSGGDSSQTKSAKDTILYSIVGIVVAAGAYAIVNFVLANL